MGTTAVWKPSRAGLLRKFLVVWMDFPLQFEGHREGLDLEGMNRMGHLMAATIKPAEVIHFI